jgi:hypothetical protein
LLRRISIGDGNVDLAIANGGGNSLTLLLGNGSGLFAPASGSPFAVGSSPNSLAIGDFDKDGDIDLAIAVAGDNKVAIWLGNGVGRFKSKTVHNSAVGTTPSDLAVCYYATTTSGSWLGTAPAVLAAYPLRFPPVTSLTPLLQAT